MGVEDLCCCHDTCRLGCVRDNQLHCATQNGDCSNGGHRDSCKDNGGQTRSGGDCIKDNGGFKSNSVENGANDPCSEETTTLSNTSSSSSGYNSTCSAAATTDVVDGGVEETLLIDLDLNLGITEDPWATVKIVTEESAVKEQGNWVMFDEQEAEKMSRSFLQLSQRKSPVPILSQLPAHASELEFGALAGSPSKFCSTYGSPHRGSHLTQSQLMTPVGSPSRNEPNGYPIKHTNVPPSPIKYNNGYNNIPARPTKYNNGLSNSLVGPSQLSTTPSLNRNINITSGPQSPTTAVQIQPTSKHKSIPSSNVWLPSSPCLISPPPKSPSPSRRPLITSTPSTDPRFSPVTPRRSSPSPIPSRLSGIAPDRAKDVWTGSQSSSGPWNIVPSHKQTVSGWKAANSGERVSLDLLS